MRYLIAFIVLSGCATPAQRAAADIEKYGPYCDSIGFRSGSDAWRMCIVQARGNAIAGSGVAAQHALH